MDISEDHLIKLKEIVSNVDLTIENNIPAVVEVWNKVLNPNKLTTKLLEMCVFSDLMDKMLQTSENKYQNYYKLYSFGFLLGYKAREIELEIEDLEKW